MVPGLHILHMRIVTSRTFTSTLTQAPQAPDEMVGSPAVTPTL